jgi:hypothetical protein
MAASRDVTVLRDLVRQYADICREPAQDERRALWRKHNSLKPTRPLIYVRAFAWSEMPQAKCVCEDPFFKSYEAHLRHQLFWHSLRDDSIFEPWLTVSAARTCYGWGLKAERHFSGESRGSYKVDYPIKQLEDAAAMRVPWHGIDEAKTAESAGRLRDAVGDLITVNVDRGPVYTMWNGDLSTDLGHLRGIEHVMLDMLDNPEWLHRLLGFMSRGVLKAQSEAEAAGDLGLCNHQNQAMPYAEELPDPAANRTGVRRKQLWGYMAAQEFTAVSPAMHEEFLLDYQLPILREFGLVAYGCCEDLTTKIDMLRKIPNLRRIAVSPFADCPRCAAQIGKDYVISYRPSPTDMVGYGYDEARIRKILERDLSACRGCHVDLTLKDVETVEGDPERVRRWVGLARSIAEAVL